MKKVLIVESPSKVKTISKFLGKDFIVTSTKGHIRDLPIKTLGIEIKPSYIGIEYENLKNKTETIKELIKVTCSADIVYLAPDPDREGEIIAFHTKEIIEKKIGKDAKIYRITFNEITKKAVTEAIKNTREIDDSLVSAQQARRILDRLVGYKVSPILWKKVARGLSAGRVQSVALKIICIREKEIRAFVIEDYWTIHGVFEIEKIKINADVIKIDGKKIEKITEKEAKDACVAIKKQSWVIDSIKDSERIRKPYAPFITSTLQQAAYNQLCSNSQQTMMTAQKMYEGIPIKDSTVALITYMRTDSTRISESAIKDVREFIEKNYTSTYLPSHSLIYSKSAAQDAHEAIRPIDVSVTPESIKKFVEPAIYKLYDLIWRRFVACQMESAIYTNRQILLDGGKGSFTAKTSGSVIKFDGFLKVYNMNEEEEDENKLPPLLREGEKADLEKATPKQHFTQPPARYSEATLIKELEGKGIGRPSTYTAIMKTIRDRLYTLLDEKKRFVPTELGMMIADILDENLPEIMDIGFTSKLEEQLDAVADGKMSRDELVHGFYNNFSKSLEKFEKKKLERAHEETDFLCGEDGCVGKLIVKVGKTGEFLGCSRYPDCKFTCNFKRNEQGVIEKEEQKKDEQLDLTCPTCGKNLAKKHGRFGEFIACSGYPECKYIHKEKTKALCPECYKDGLVKRKWKNNIFWSCGSYPACKFGISADIIEQECPECKFPFLKKIGKGGIAFSCAGNTPKNPCSFVIEEK